jgi:uncharacterized protein
MANAYVKDPRKIAKPGDVVRVKVLEVDPKRRRISLTMRLAICELDLSKLDSVEPPRGFGRD